MATFAQIAQQTFEFDREDGTTRRWQYTFEQKDGTAESYTIPKTNSTKIKHGDRSDDPTKPLKISEAVFTLKGVNEPLIDVIDSCGTREIRVTIEDLATGRTEFQGFVLPEFSSKRELYNDLVSLKVRCYGALADMDEEPVPEVAVNRTIHEAAEKVGTVIDLPRELDLYTSLRHENQPSDIELPTKLRFIEQNAVGNKDGKNYKQVIESALTGFGWRMFQHNGRLAIADIYDQFANRTGLTKYESNGDGTYTKSTTGSKVVTLDKTNSIRFPERQRKKPVIRHRQIRSIPDRFAAQWSDPSPFSIGKGGETTYEFDRGLALGGDKISIGVSGSLETGNEPNVTGDVQWLRVELHDNNGGTWHYDPIGGTFKNDAVYHFEDSFTFISQAGDPSKSWDFDFTGELGTVPDEIEVCEVRLVAECKVTIDSGDGADLVGNDFDDFNASIEYKDEEATVSRISEVESGEEKGQVTKSVSYLGDENLSDGRASVQYYNPSLPELDAWQPTSNWLSDEGNGVLVGVVASRVGRVIVGEGQEFRHRVRDTIGDIDLLTTLEVTLDDGSTALALPESIEHDIDNGYYYIRSREIFDGAGSANTFYTIGESSDVGSSTGTDTIGDGSDTDGGGGVRDHGFLDGLDDPSDHLWAAQNDLSNVDPTTGRSALDMGPSDVVPLGQTVLNNPPSQDTHALRGGQMLNTDDPITGQGKLRNGLHIGLNFNNTNLKSGASGLDTIQDIDTGADPEFRDLLIRMITMKTDGGFESTDFTSGGFAGEGVRLEEDANGLWHLIVDKLTARNTFYSYKSEIRKLFVRGGSDWWSDGHTVDEVELIGDGSWSWADDTIQPFQPGATNAQGIPYAFANQYRCYIPEDVLMSLQVDDLVMAKESDGRNAFTCEGVVINVETGAVDPEDNSTRRYFDIALAAGSAAPEAGLAFVRYGNRSDQSRQASMFATASEPNAPYLRLYDKVNRADKFGTVDSIVGQLGKLDGLDHPKFDDLDGNQQDLYGILIANGYFDGTLSSSTMAAINLFAHQIVAGTIDTERLDTDEILARMATIAGLTIEGNKLYRSGTGSTLLELIGNNNPALHLVSESGEEVWIGGNYSDDEQSDVTIDDSNFSYDPLRSQISDQLVTADADSNNSQDTDRYPSDGYQEATYDFGSQYNGRLVRFSMDYNLDENTATATNENGDTVESAASATFECIFEILDSGGSVVDSHSTTVSGNNSGTFAGVLQIPDNADNHSLRLRWYIRASATARSYIAPNQSTAWLGASASASWSESGSPLTVISIGEYYSPKGFQLVDESTGKRIYGSRADGELLSNIMSVENDDGSVKWNLEIDSNGNLELHKNGTFVTEWS